MEGIRKSLIGVLSLVLFFLFSNVSAASKHLDEHRKGSKHFVLVHGAGLGAWSWYKTVRLLESAEHRVTAIDLAASGTNLMRADDLRSFSDYSKPLRDFMSSLPQHHRVILVAHSLGGASISLAMELFPEKVSVGVFVTAAMPGPAFPFSDFVQMTTTGGALSEMDNNVTYGDGPNNPPTTFKTGPKYASEVFYQYSPSEDAALAILLIRPLSLRILNAEKLVFTEAKYGSVKRVFIVVEEDQVLPIDIQKLMIKKNPPNKVLTISGADHLVMASKPIKLLAHLLSIAQDFA